MSIWRCITPIALGLASLGIHPSHAQENFPSRPLTIINPWAAGSPTDVMARTLAEEMHKQLGQSIVVISREGGSGVIGMNVLAQSAPDGLTMAFTPMTPITIQPHYIKGLKLSPEAVQPLCGVTENILGVSVRADSPYKTITELVTAARQKPLNYGSPGPNSAPYLAIDQLERDQKLQLNHIPYKGDSGSIQELLAGRLDFVSSIAASAAPQVRAGKLRLLAVSSEHRHPAFPDIPTFKELGMKVREDSFAGLFVPRGVPEAALAKLDAACASAAKSEPVKRIAQSGDQVVNYQNRQQWQQRISAEFRKQGETAKRNGATQ
ncbi:tripartite tricarboxylate transporter substrate binding protein [Comamonas testosteroni]|uniref:Tripartite tricarboxylate transporter substrate binding protein n=1 Tax=Comamonas testosteroni TaxID=285 RepID=A0A373FQS9_COMTE|nr:tripartite tricarboxylate transporter substrate binding protein [Comamonas testosteroni]RGE46227.1 tripartite tricarboxylate transporter substrate binding protein [Comamonas testosteroni]